MADLRGEATLVLLGMKELQRQHGRLSEVTVEDVERLLTAVGRALAAEPTESLDAAWAAAEPWGLNERPDLTDDLRWEAHRGITYEYGPTPIAALNALSQALRSEQEKA